MQEYQKIVYAWNEPKDLIEVPTRLVFRALDENSLSTLVHATSQVMTDSLDRGDQKHVQKLGAEEAAKSFIAEANDYFDYDLTWWQLAYNHNEELAGFVLPVLFPGCQKDGLEEATVYYMGVLPQQRGHGYGYDLLCKCTRVMQEVGVWRIYCDTDVYNAPMIGTFQKVGYEQEGGPKVVE